MNINVYSILCWFKVQYVNHGSLYTVRESKMADSCYKEFHGMLFCAVAPARILHGTWAKWGQFSNDSAEDMWGVCRQALFTQYRQSSLTQRSTGLSNYDNIAMHLTEKKQQINREWPTKSVKQQTKLSCFLYTVPLTTVVLLKATIRDTHTYLQLPLGETRECLAASTAVLRQAQSVIHSRRTVQSQHVQGPG